MGRRSTVRLVDVLPTVVARSRMDRDLRAWLRERTAPDLPAHRRIDPAQFRLTFSNRAGRAQINMASLHDDLAGATRKLLILTNELYLDFLSAPERYNWIVDTFELDPDNPRWP